MIFRGTRRRASIPAARQHSRNDRASLSEGADGSRLALGSLARRLAEAGRARVQGRHPRPWLGMIGMPLALIAVSLAGVWWAWLPLIGSAWWWTPDTHPWGWLGSVQAGVIGTEWAFLGASALAAFPTQRWIVGGVWIGAALLIALIAAVSRRGVA